jgi:hypothetical protein
MLSHISSQLQEADMHFRNLQFATVAAGIMIVSIGLIGGLGQGLTDEIRVMLPEPVTVGDVVLEPGDYEIRKASTTTNNVLSIFSNDKLRYEGVVLTIPAFENKTPEDTTVVLHHIGPDYYFDKIWIAGKQYGYEFVLPERAQSLKRELALTIPATYQSLPQTPGSGSAGRAQAERAEQAEREREAAIAESNRRADAERNAQLERDRQAQVERERQEQADRDRQQDIAALQQDRNAPAPAASDASVAGSQANAQSDPEDRDQLPATATNWLGLVLGGFLLLSLSILVRSLSSQE